MRWRKTFSGPDGIVYEYSYDDNNELTGVEIPGKGFITYTSYTWNRPASVTLPGGSTKDYVYDPLMRVQSITAKDPAQNVLMNYQYTYDQMDNILNKATRHGTYAYTYDDLNRLTGADNPALHDEAFTYDPVGNRFTAANTTGNWSYNENNELSGYDDVSCEYDANGNMIEKTAGGDVTNYIYNIEDRLVEVRDGSGSLVSSYYYDPLGRRLWKDVGGTTTYFFYADEGLVGEYDAAGSEIKTYGYKPGSTWTTDPLFMKQGSDYYFYQNDHLGTPQKLTAINGAVVWAAKYTSFGEATVDELSTITNNLRFPGQIYDEETGLHHNWHRYYDPKTGRYLRADPIGLVPFDAALGCNHLYSYVNGNPLNSIDFLGLSETECGPDCPSGDWVIDQGGTGSISLIFGYSRTPVTFRCKGANKACHGVFVCKSFGFQANIGFQWNIDIEEAFGTGSIIKNVRGVDELKDYTYSSWLVGAGPFSTAGNNIALGPSIGLNIAKQKCKIEDFWCQ